MYDSGVDSLRTVGCSIGLAGGRPHPSESWRTQYPKPSTLNPKTETLNPEPHVLNAEVYTLNLKLRP